MAHLHPLRFARVVSYLVGFSLLVCSAGAEETPPWKTAGHPFFNNPIGYARNLHSQYVGNQAGVAATRAALKGYDQEKVTPSGGSLLGGLNAVREAVDLARLKRDAKDAIAAGEKRRGELEAEWRKWCELGLLGSPMPPLSTAIESIADTYLDKSREPWVQKVRMRDRVDYNLKYFLEDKAAASAAAPPPTTGSGGGAPSGTFTKDPFNGLQVTYSISGASLDAPSDGCPFEGWVRAFTGTITGRTLSFSGTATITCTNRSLATVSASVWAGDKRQEVSFTLETTATTPTKITKPFSLSVEVPAGAKEGGFSVTDSGSYGNGETRFVQVGGSLKRVVAAEPEQQVTRTPPVLSTGSAYPGGWLTPVAGSGLRLVPSGKTDAAGTECSSLAPLSWRPGDRLVTGPASPAAILFPSDLRAVLRPHSRLKFSESAAALETGSLLLDLLKPGKPFRVATSTASVKGDGALFTTVFGSDRSTVVAVGVGSVSLATPDGKSAVKVGANQFARIAPGGKPSAPQKLSDAQQQSMFGDVGLLSPPGLTLYPAASPAPVVTKPVTKPATKPTIAKPRPGPAVKKPSTAPVVTKPSAATPAVTATIRYLRGEVHLRGTTASGEQMLETGVNSRGALISSDGSRALLGGKTKLAYGPGGLRLLSGSILVRSPGSGPSAKAIAPNGVAGCSSGAIYSLRIAGDGSVFAAVKQGQVWFADKKGANKVTISAGQYSMVKPEKRPSKPQTLGSKMADSFFAELSTLDGA